MMPVLVGSLTQTQKGWTDDALRAAAADLGLSAASVGKMPPGFHPQSALPANDAQRLLQA